MRGKRSSAASLLFALVALAAPLDAAADGPFAPASKVLRQIPPQVRLQLDAGGTGAQLMRLRSGFIDSFGQVHIEGRTLVERPVCQEPCGVLVPAIGVFRVTGSSIVSSSEFQLPSDARLARVDVHAGSIRRLAGGAATAALGGLALAAGGLLLVTSVDFQQQKDAATYNPNLKSPSDFAISSTRLGAEVLLPLGLVAVVTGLVLVVLTRTTVDVAKVE